MTEQEAFERIKDELPFESGVINEALSVVERACEKRIPKKPIKVMDSGIRYTDEYICPACENHFTGTGIADYCYHCGQAIEWEELE